jgi:hypothetical protein
MVGEIFGVSGLNRQEQASINVDAQRFPAVVKAAHFANEMLK